MVHGYLRQSNASLNLSTFNLPSAWGHSETHVVHHKLHSIRSIRVSAAQQIQ